MFLRPHQWSAAYAREQVKRFASQHYENCHKAASFYTEKFKSVEAEDVVQQAFAQLIEEAPTLDNLTDVCLDGCIHRNMCSIVLRAVNRDNVIKPISYLQNISDNSTPIDEIVNQHYEHELLNKVLDSLPDLHKEYLKQKYISQFSDERISKELGIPVAQLPMLDKYALDTAREIIEKS